MGLLYLMFYACRRLRFLDVQTNQGPRRGVPAVCRMLCSNVRGLSGNLSNLAVASSRYDVLLCSETLVSGICHLSELQVHLDLVALSCCAGARCLGPQGWTHLYEMDTEHFANPNLSVAGEKSCFTGVCDVRQNFYVFSLYRKPD